MPADTTSEAWAREFAELEQGRRFKLRDEFNAFVPKRPGTYAIWRGEEFVYVGMAGRMGRKSDVTLPQYEGGGLLGRLEAHAHGRRSGDQFCIYVCDRFVLPSLSREEIKNISEACDSLDVRTRAYIHAHLDFTFVTTATPQAASALEGVLRRGLWPRGKPVLNPWPRQRGSGS